MLQRQRKAALEGLEDTAPSYNRIQAAYSDILAHHILQASGKQKRRGKVNTQNDFRKAVLD